MTFNKFNTSEDEDMLFAPEFSSSFKSNKAPKNGPISFKFGSFDKNKNSSNKHLESLFDDDEEDEIVL